MSVVVDIAQHLQNIGFGTVGIDIFAAYAPSDVCPLISVHDNGGPAPDPYLPTKRPGFQVFVRGASYVAGRALFDQVRNALHRVVNTNIGNTFFYYIYAVSEGGDIGRNEAGQDEFSINFDCLTR